MKKGFTLIELLVVVAIIGVLASMVMSSLNDARVRARDAKRHADIKTIQNALELYYLDNNHYPYFDWRHSSSETQWAEFEAELGVTLPKDPVNTGRLTTSHASDGLTYSYYGRYFGCHGEWYMLTYVLEGDAVVDSPGVNRCDSTSKFNYYGGYGAITVGMNNIEG